MKIAINNNSSDTAVLYIALTAIISAIATTTTSAAASATAAESLCKPFSDIWGDVDPNIFYICNEQTGTAIALQCPEGRGFFNGYGYNGCIPYVQWPACISANSMTQTCDSEHLLQPWQTLNPNKFFMCVAEALDPVLVSCESGKGFVNAQQGGSNIVGCAKWEKWRAYMNCVDYY